MSNFWGAVQSLLTPFLCLLGVLFCSVSSDSPHLLCYLCSFRISLFSLRPLSLCFLSLLCFLCFLSDFHISPDPPVRTKTFSTHNKPKNNHDVRGKRFNARARMLPSPRFSVASAFVPHLCFLSLLCYVRYLCYIRILLVPFHRPFSLLSLLTLFLCLLGVLFCSVFSDFPHLLCYLCSFRISLFSLRPLSLCFLSLLCFLCFLSDFHISPDPPVRTKTFFTHNKLQNNHDVRRKRFNAHARMLPSPRFSVASAFVPHLCFLSLLCYVRILLAPFHCLFSLFALISLFT